MLGELQDNIKWNNIRIIGIAEGEEEEQWIENLFEKVMMENFPNLMKEKVTQIQETKERILKTTRERQGVTYKGAEIRLAAGFSVEALQARREWPETFLVMRTRGLQPRLL